MTANNTVKLKRSIELTRKQVQFLEDHIQKFDTITEAAIDLGISKDVLSRTIAFGSCSEKTYNKLFSEKSEPAKVA
jgi:hypothetical protein